MTAAAALAAPRADDPWLAAARSAITDLVRDALSLTCTVVGPTTMTEGWEGALVPIVSSMAPVQVGLFSTSEGCAALARALLCCGPDDPLERAEIVDACREIVNMLSGSVKGRVSGYASSAALGLPTFVHGWVESSPHQRVEALATTVGTITVTVVVIRPA